MTDDYTPTTTGTIAALLILASGIAWLIGIIVHGTHNGATGASAALHLTPALIVGFLISFMFKPRLDTVALAFTALVFTLDALNAWGVAA